MRLNRFLSCAGVSSRRKGEALIGDGRVTVNGETVTDPARAVEPEKDRVCLDGRPIGAERARRYVILNKPPGVIVSVGDRFGRPAVNDLLGEDGKGLFPVGRLDSDTSGVLLLTDDGEMAYRLTHPSYGVEKIYRAVVRGNVKNEVVHRIEEGVTLEDGPTAPARMRVLSRGRGTSTVELTLHQGRKRQVRRMLEHVGHPVIDLERISFGGITAKGIGPGSYRPLADSELSMLRKAVQKKPASGFRLEIHCGEGDRPPRPAPGTNASGRQRAE